ncbi:unnamed protein product, partial [Discosporangium mesarthrocarpum]
EARYRGRGKYYKGKISRVNSDGTFDINYDDGERERGLAVEHVKSLEPEHGERSTTGASKLLEGDKVEANYRGKGRFYKGQISRVNLDGTFNIDYDDGEKERGVPEDMVRSTAGGGRDTNRTRKLSESNDEKNRAGGTRLREGDKVEARYRGRGKYYRGNISRVNSDGTFDIDYEDGEKERGLAEQHVKPLE